jgi:hypothetical protein
MDLLERTWGYMLYTNISVQSTLLEGFTANGSLRYLITIPDRVERILSHFFFLKSYRYYQGYNNDSAYTSHSHGWSSGPTSALTFYLLGLTVTSTQGKTWNFSPHLNTGIPSSEGGFETPLGRFDASWSFDKDIISGNDVFNVRITTPEGTQGIVRLPSNMTASYVLDGAQRNVRLVGPAEMEVTGGSLDISWNTTSIS